LSRNPRRGSAHSPRRFRSLGGSLVLMSALAVLCSNRSAAAGPSPGPSPAPQRCADLTRSVSDELLHDDILSDGAIITTYGRSHVINPYFGNLVAQSFMHIPGGADAVEAWMQWYLRHLNMPDAEGVYGTIDDYTVDEEAVESSQHRADSTDAYAATFLTLARSLYETGDAGKRTFVRGLKYQLDVIGGVMIKEQQPDGLTWAKSSYRVAYLLDNCEVYRGLEDLSVLMNSAFHDPKAAFFYAQHADSVKQGINTKLWDADQNRYLIAEFASGEKDSAVADKWYPDTYAQLFPVTEGVLQPSDPRAVRLYAALNHAFPQWSSPAGHVSGPIGAIGYAAALMGDTTRAKQAVAALDSARSQRRAESSGTIAERAWLVRVCGALAESPAAKPKEAPNS
jgi:hypothetical protein